MPNLFSRQSLGRQVMLVVTGLLLLLIVAIAWSATRTYREREADLREQASVVVATEAAYLDQRLDNLDALATVVTAYPTVRALDPAGSRDLLASLLARYPFLLNIVVTDPAGRIRGSAVELPAAGPARYDAACLETVMRTGRPCTGPYAVDALLHRPTIVLAYPIPGEDGQPAGVLDLALNLLTLQGAFASIPLPAGSVVTLTDRASRVLVRSRDAEKYVGRLVDPGHALAPSQVPPIDVRRGLDGVAEIFGNAVIARGPWVLSVGLPVSLALDRVWPLWRRNFFIAVGTVLAMMLFGLFLARGIAQPLGALTRIARQIAGGDFSPPPPTAMPNREFAQLHDDFRTMAARLAEARAALDEQVAQERRAREEVQELQNQVVRQERLAAVGLLVSGVGHELNNPLQAILGATELIQRTPDLPREALDEVAFIQEQGARARDIIRNLSRFSRQDASPATPVHLGEVVAAVLQLRGRDPDRPGVRCDVELQSTRPVVGGFTELQQVVLNFVLNAEQALTACGRPDPRIAIRVRDVDGSVRLEVGDNGTGVAEADQAKLFQPFFTTKPVGEGTGLGLSVSYGIIDAYGGTIGYRGNDWGGATFYFDLPAHSSGGVAQA
ncbi:MAG: HAMP domain-containing protein [Acidobacteriota bacterium]|nr:HAMP domain-containing protein [Acidobacteriota bacterium]